MAIFGDLGKVFGLGTAGEVAGDVAQFFGAPASVSKPISAAAQFASEGISSIGGKDRPDVATAPAAAGVDSPATLSNVSQTGRLQPSGGGQMMQSGLQAGFGLAGPLSQLVGQGARLLSKPGVGAAIGGLGAGAVLDVFLDEFGQPKKLVITRKLQRDIKKIFMMTGGDVRTTSDIYRSATGRFIPEDMIFKIIIKTFKNQGPYVTKAAVRKTRSTIRKMETLCDLKDRLAPPRRAAPRRRATSTTKVLQVK